LRIRNTSFVVVDLLLVTLAQRRGIVASVDLRAHDLDAARVERGFDLVGRVIHLDRKPLDLQLQVVSKPCQEPVLE
jgi:hypothetical protein